MRLDLNPEWNRCLASEFEQPYFRRLEEFVDAERESHIVYPAESDVFRAFCHTSLDQVRVVIVGQDPYHDEGQAQGLAFSVPVGEKIPPSLKNIFKEMAADLPGFQIPDNGCLLPWAEKGVLLLNTVLTVRAHAANSHRGKGWETFTDAVLRTIDQSENSVIFVLWGDPAQKKEALIDHTRHLIIRSPHPSPLSAYRGFFGSRPFSRINAQLQSNGLSAIDWSL